MEFSYETIRNILDSEFGDGYYYTASEYGEPGYYVDNSLSTPMVVIADYWCRCGKRLDAEG